MPLRRAKGQADGPSGGQAFPPPSRWHRSVSPGLLLAREGYADTRSPLGRFFTLCCMQSLGPASSGLASSGGFALSLFRAAAAAPQAHLGARIAGARQKYLPPYLREPPPAPEPAPAPAPAPRAQVRIMRALQHRVAVLSPLRPVLAGLRRKAGRTLVGLRVPARAAEGWAAARRAASSVGQ